MKPDFALLLSFDGIALLRRASAYGGSPDGWHELHKVAPTVPDLPAALKKMRFIATEAGQSPDPEVKLVLPTEQVKFLDVAAPERGISVAEAVEAALDGETPYAIDELVYDFHVEGGEVHIAAVARETLEEAESFAVDNGFLPLGFVSDVAAGAGFKREPFFGPTQTALTTLTPGLTVQGDDLPIKVLGGPPPAQSAPAAPPEPQPEPVEAPEPAAEPAPADARTEDLHPELADAPKSEAQADLPLDSTAATEAETDRLPDNPPETTPVEEDTLAEPPNVPVAAETQNAESDPARHPDVLDETKANEATTAAQPTDADAPDISTHAMSRGISSPEPSLPALEDPAPEQPATASKPDSFASAPPALTADRTNSAATSPAVQAPLPPQDVPSDSPGFASIRARRDAPVPPARGLSDSIPQPKPANPINASLSTGAKPRPGPGPKITPVAAPSASASASASESEVSDLLAAKARDSFAKRPKNGDLPVEDTRGTVTVAPAALTADSGPMTPPAKPVGFASRRNGSAGSGGPGQPVTASGVRHRKPEAARTRVATAAMATGAALEESERMTVFGARGKQKVGGKPRYLGVLLTAALVLVMLAVAAWATLVLDDGLAGLVRRDTQTPVVASIVVADAEAGTSQSAQDDPAAETGSADQPVLRPVPETALALPETAPEVDTADPTAIVVAGLSEGVPAMSRDLVEDQVEGLSVPFEAETLSPEQAEARYAATGIWQRAPAPPAEPGQNEVGDVYVASIDPEVSVGDAIALPAAREATTDLLPGAQGNPYPPDADLSFDDDGLIKPTPEGVVHPDGFRLVLGPPPVKPPLRPGTADPQPAAQPAPVTAPETPAETPSATPSDTSDASEPATGAGTSIAPDASLVPTPVPENNIATGPDAAETPEPEIDSRDVAAALAPVIAALQNDASEPETALAAPVVTDPTLAGLRPNPRPGDLIEQNERANLGGVSLAELRQKRPLTRPEQDAAKAEAEKQVEASALAVAASVQPKPRPANIAALVTRATQQQQEQLQRQQQLRSAPVATASSAGTVAPRTVSPSIPTRSSVAAAATEKNAINLRKVNLIGVYGKPSSRRALVRLPNGRYTKVKVGDRIDGGRVSSIGDGQLSYVKSGRNIVLRMPRS